MALELEGKVALVSGGSKGIGLAVARTLALNGAKVAILSRHAGNLEQARQVLAGQGVTVLPLSLIHI